MTSRYLPTRLRLFLTLFLALLLLTVQGCFHSSGGGGGTVADADPTGYYTNTGDATVSDGASGTITINDLQAMVSGNRIMMMSVANELLYDGTITSITGNSFTADFTIYEKGGDINAAPPMTATASGTITAGSSITGTLTGSGVGSGSFSLKYALTGNNEVADLARIKNVAGGNATWGAGVGGSSIAQTFAINAAGTLTEVDFSGGIIFGGCELDGALVPINGSSFYSVSVVMTTCGSNYSDGTYTGLATSRTDSNTDDTLVFAVSNGLYGMAGDFK